MNGTRTLLAGPSGDAVTRRAFTRATELAGAEPDSVLCLTESREDTERLGRQWRDEYDPLRFRCATLDDFVSDCFERATGRLATATLSRAARSRLVEAALEIHGDRASNGPFVGIEQPANALVDQMRGLFSLLEYAGYDTPDAIAHALRTAGTDGSDDLVSDALYGSFQSVLPTRAESPLDEQATVVSDVYDAYRTLVANLYPDTGTVAEQYLHLLRNDALLAAVPDAVDVVVLHGLTRLAPAEREAVARLAEANPTLGAVAATHPSLDATGLDAGVESTFELYDALDFELEYRTPETTNDRRLSVARAMYAPEQPAEDLPSPAELGLSITTASTERAEVRLVARQVRSRLAAGVAPADIGVVVTDRASYRGPLAEVLSGYDVPFTFHNEVGIEGTVVGATAGTLLALVDEPTPSLLGDLCTNGLVSFDDTAIEPATVRRAVAATERASVDALVETLNEMDEPAVAAGITDLLNHLEPTADSVTAVTDTLTGALDLLSVPETVEQYGDDDATGSHRPAYERSALRAVERILSSFDGVSQHLSTVDPVARVRQALLAELVGGPRRRPGYVDVRPLAEAATTAYDHLFVLGLTMDSFPEESDRMRFFAAVNEADEEFGRAHTGRRARYVLGTLLTGSDHVTLSRPRHTVDGTDHVPAPVLSELERYVSADREPTPTPPDRTAEDCQRTYAAWARGEAFDTADRATAPLAAADWFPASGRQFAVQGARCAWRRSQPDLTPHDAQIGEIIDEVFPADRREPYSPSAVEEYARCPFLFMSKRILGFEEDYGSANGVSYADRGTYVHDVLAVFYRRLREAADTPVRIETVDRQRAEALLLDVALDRLDELGAADTPFAGREVGQLLGGLGDPDANPYHEFGGQASTGLFASILDAEYEDQPGVGTQPTYLEGSMGLDFDDVELLSADPVEIDTPAGPVPLHGVADRVDVATGTGTPREFHVRDYKTGRAPGRRDVVRGTKLQLPLYGLALETALSDGTGVAHEVVGGSYYALGDPADIDPTSGLVAARADVEDGALLPAVSAPWLLPFEERSGFRSFVRAVTPVRLGQIATAVEGGAFEPTLLPASQAGCDHCSFRAVCDVRHHHRRDTISRLDWSEHYVSERATDDDLDLSEYRMDDGAAGQEAED